MNHAPSKLPSQHSLKSELIYSVPFSFLSAHLFVAFRQEENLFEIIFKSGYTIAVSASTIIAFSMILIVKYATRRLDRKKPWHVHRLRRGFLQLCYGFCGALLIEFGLSWAYFGYHGYSISETIWSESYLLPISMYILIINLYYNSYPEFVAVPKRTDEPIEVTTSAEPKIESNLEKELAYEVIRKDALEKNVVYISISDKIIYAKDRKAEAVLWYGSLAESMAALNSDDFYFITRSCIVHRDIIGKLTPDPTKQKLIVALKPPFNEELDVAQKNIRDVIAWCEAKSV